MVNNLSIWPLGHNGYLSIKGKIHSLLGKDNFLVSSCKDYGYFSPSQYHQAQYKKVPLTLSYRGGDVREWQEKARVKLIELLWGIPERDSLQEVEKIEEWRMV